MSTAPSCLRKSALSIAMGLCLASLVAAPAFAQSATGAVAGRAASGDQITIVNAATGASRNVTVNSDGSYRIGQLPPGDYTLTAGTGAPVNVNVSLGGTTTVNLDSGGGIANLDVVEVQGSRVVNRVDVRSTESATNVTREELAPLAQAGAICDKSIYSSLGNGPPAPVGVAAIVTGRGADAAGVGRRFRLAGAIAR